MKKEQRSEVCIEGKLDVSHSKGFRVEELTVPTFAGEVEIRFDYSPRAIAGLNNHLNLLVYDSLGNFVGRYDRGTERFVISAQNASPCAMQILPLPGRWRLLLEAHALSGEVTYRIEAVFRGSENYSWKRGELHTHSVHSDGVMTVTELSDYLHELGVDFFFLTDHSNVAGWRDLPNTKGAVGFPGEELNTYHGHGLILGAKGFVDWKSWSLSPIPSREIHEYVRKSGGLFGVAHPFMPGDPICVGCEWKHKEGPFAFDFVEIWSQLPDEFSLLNQRTVYLWIESLRTGGRVTGVAGSDLHKPTPVDQYALRTEVRVRRLSLFEVLYAIKKGMVRVNSDVLKSFKVNGKEPGEIVCWKGKGPLITIVTEQRKDCRLGIVTQKDVLDLGEVSEAEIRIPSDSLEKNDFVLVWIKNSKDQTLAATNPVVLKREEDG